MSNQKKRQKNEGYSHNDSPDSPDSPELKGEPTKNQVQNEKYFSGLKDEILKLTESEAPKAKYHSLKPKAIYDMIGLRFPEASINDVFKICEQAVKEGILLKNEAGGYSMNPEWLNGGGS